MSPTNTPVRPRARTTARNRLLGSADVLQQRRFVIETYRKVADAYFLARRKHPKESAADLSIALDTLCNSLEKLLHDREFWAALIESLKARGAKERLKELTSDIEAQLDLDAAELTQAQALHGADYDGVDINELMLDIREAFLILRDNPSGRTYLNLHTRLSEVARKICAIKRHGGGRRWWLAATTATLRGVLIFGGLTLIVINAAAFTHTGHVDVFLKSTLTGAQATNGGIGS